MEEAGSHGVDQIVEVIQHFTVKKVQIGNESHFRTYRRQEVNAGHVQIQYNALRSLLWEHRHDFPKDQDKRFRAVLREMQERVYSLIYYISGEHG